MAILFDEATRQFRLHTDASSYIIRLLDGKYLLHAYWGARVRAYKTDVYARFCGAPEEAFTLQEMPTDRLPQEFPAFGHGDSRMPAVHILQVNGSRVSDLTYRAHRITKGKPPLEGLPATFSDECETLEIDLADDVSGVRVTLMYSVFEAYNAIARSAVVTNAGAADVRIEKLDSACVDFDRSDFDILTLSGAWARERAPYRRALVPGAQGVGSLHGASGHQQSPFVALLSKDATETNGDAYGMALVYSGNFEACADVSQFGQTRAHIGLQPFDFSWLLAPGERFQSPEAVLVYSGEGLGRMSRDYHRLWQNCLMRSSFANKPRPILINNWEATYFGFDEEKLLSIARAAKKAGVELFVLDDGWFGKRDSDNCSLGDWVCDTRKLPGGIGGLAEKINKEGLLFGLWFEPEMVSPDSELYRAHPDWCIHVKNRERLEARHQLILDLSREDVCDYIISAVSAVLQSANIAYVKWDMNRNMSDIGGAQLPPERQRELPHRYMLGLYRVMKTITERFPSVLFEGCAGGGGRFDAGILAYMPQIWCSDNTDAICRSQIQYATTLVFPPSAMGAHVSAVPNHQTGRTTPMETRAAVAMCGTFGYELDATKLSDDELAQMKKQTDFFKEIKPLMQNGALYRLRSPFEGDDAAWCVVSPDKARAVATLVKTLKRVHMQGERLRLDGLDKSADYAVRFAPFTAQSDTPSFVMGGDELMASGLPVPAQRFDFESRMVVLERV